MTLAHELHCIFKLWKSHWPVKSEVPKLICFFHFQFEGVHLNSPKHSGNFGIKIKWMKNVGELELLNTLPGARCHQLLEN